MANPYPVIESTLFSNQVPSSLDMAFLHVIVGLLNDAYSSGYSGTDKKTYLASVLESRFGREHPAVAKIRSMLN